MYMYIMSTPTLNRYLYVYMHRYCFLHYKYEHVG